MDFVPRFPVGFDAVGSLWLVVTDAAAQPAAGSPGCAVAADDSPAAGWCAVSARLRRMLCTGPVLRARDFDGDTKPDTIHANNTYASVKIDHFQTIFHQ